MKLRPYQQLATAKTVYFLNNREGNPLVVAPTGSGKSLMMAALCAELKGRILLLAHRKELLTQNGQAIKKFSPDTTISFYSNSVGQKDLSGDIVIAGISSIARVERTKLPKFDYIIVDECHLVNNVDDGQYRKLISYYPDARVIGFSATPFRLRGGFLHKAEDSIFADIAFDIPIVELIEKNFLCPLTNKCSAVEVDLEGLHTRAGEFIQSEYDAKFNDEELIRDTVTDILQHAGERSSWLLFCSSVDHAQKVNLELQRNGVKSMTVTGETPQDERDRIIKLFREKRLVAITNCDVLTVGFDAPNVDLIALLRPTKSCGLYIQMVGRGTRLHPDKSNCMVLDYGGNIERFGPIDQIKLRQNRFGKVEVDEIKLKVCPECRECVHLKHKICPSCEYAYPQRQIERSIKHTAFSSNLNILKSSLMKMKFDGEQVLQVYDYKFALHKKPGKPPSVRIDYYISATDKVSEWICPEHYGFAGDRARAWWNSHAPNIEYQPSCKFVMDNKDLLTLPDKIVVELQSTFPVIKSRYFPNNKRVISDHNLQAREEALNEANL